VEYKFSQESPITEEEALRLAADMGLHSLAFDLVVNEDEPLHWHEFSSVSWVIEGTGAFSDGEGNVTEVSPGCRLEAPAGWLHSNLAGLRFGWCSPPTCRVNSGRCRSTRTQLIARIT
jgi:hypothetical protein